MRPAAAIIVCLLLTGCDAAPTPAVERPQPVAWVDHPAPQYVPPPPRALPYPTSAPPCRADQLYAARGGFGVAAGSVLDSFRFTNTGSHACLASGFPVITLIAGGRRLRLDARASPDGTQFGVMVPADIQP